MFFFYVYSRKYFTHDNPAAVKPIQWADMGVNKAAPFNPNTSNQSHIILFLLQAVVPPWLANEDFLQMWA